MRPFKACFVFVAVQLLFTTLIIGPAGAADSTDELQPGPLTEEIQIASTGTPDSYTYCITAPELAGPTSLLSMSVCDEGNRPGGTQRFAFRTSRNKELAGKGGMELVHLASGLCVDVEESGGAGANLITYPCTGNPNQAWRWESNQLVSFSHDVCVDIAGGLWNLGPTDVARLTLWHCRPASHKEGNVNQTFAPLASLGSAPFRASETLPETDYGFSGNAINDPSGHRRELERRFLDDTACAIETHLAQLHPADQDVLAERENRQQLQNGGRPSCITSGDVRDALSARRAAERKIRSSLRSGQATLDEAEAVTGDRPPILINLVGCVVGTTVYLYTLIPGGDDVYTFALKQLVGIGVGEIAKQYADDSCVAFGQQAKSAIDDAEYQISRCRTRVGRWNCWPTGIY